MGNLQAMLNQQRILQTGSFGYDPVKMPIGDKLEFIRWNILALEDELHEALAETGWKPWSTSEHLNRDQFVGELIDAWHFLMNLFLVVGVDEAEFVARYMAKRDRNAQRQAEGYDGVSGKCATCKRDLLEVGPEHSCPA